MIGDSWVVILTGVLQEKVGRDSKKRRSYSPTSVVDLLRFVRNMAHHYHTLAPEVRLALGPMEELGNYWVSTFPLCNLDSDSLKLCRNVDYRLEPTSWG